VKKLSLEMEDEVEMGIRVWYDSSTAVDQRRQVEFLRGDSTELNSKAKRGERNSKTYKSPTINDLDQ
jgi:hypothetical protein